MLPLILLSCLAGGALANLLVITFKYFNLVEMVLERQSQEGEKMRVFMKDLLETVRANSLTEKATVDGIRKNQDLAVEQLTDAYVAQLELEKMKNKQEKIQLEDGREIQLDRLELISPEDLFNVR